MIQLKDISTIVRTPIVMFDNISIIGDTVLQQDGFVSVRSAGGVRTQSFRNNSAEVAVYVKCRTQKPLTLRVGYTKSNGESTFDGVHAVTVLPKENSIIELQKTFDAASMAVYYDAVSFFVQIDCDEANTFSIEEGIVWQHSELEGTSIYDDTLEKMVLKIEDRFEQLSLESANNMESIVASPNGSNYMIKVSDDGMIFAAPTVPNNVLFVGNSLLLGMGTYGMCSSSPQNDYFYYVSEAIKEKNPDAHFYKVNGACLEQLENVEDFEYTWSERKNSATGRPIYESFIEDLDLIIIQLGSNVNCTQKAEAWIHNIDTMISRIKQSCPHARIVWVHGWYNERISGKIIADACQKWRIGHLCIKDLNTKENQAYLLQKYEKADGEAGIVDEYWITHPGNLGMKKIAERIIAYLKM